jgi:hypothetical protein
MRRTLAGVFSAGALLLAAATPAAAAPNDNACAHEPHGTERAHQTVPERNHQAHHSIPHYCH